MIKMLVRVFIGKLNCMDMEKDLQTNRQNIETMKELNVKLDDEIKARQDVADEYIRAILGNGNHATT